jgi:hypothetical protein
MLIKAMAIGLSKGFKGSPGTQPLPQQLAFIDESLRLLPLQEEQASGYLFWRWEMYNSTPFLLFIFLFPLRYQEN